MAGRQKEGLAIERDNPLDPVNLAFDKSGELARAVVRRPGRHGLHIPARQLRRRTHRADAPAYAASRRRVRHPARELVEQRRVQRSTRSRHHAVHHAGRDVRSGCDDAEGTRICLSRMAVPFCRRAASFSKARRPIHPAGASATIWTPMVSQRRAGQRVYVSSESEDITYSAKVNA